MLGLIVLAPLGLTEAPHTWSLLTSDGSLEMRVDGCWVAVRGLVELVAVRAADVLVQVPAAVAPPGLFEDLVRGTTEEASLDAVGEPAAPEWRVTTFLRTCRRRLRRRNRPRGPHHTGLITLIID
jgi:hypothetical protein